MARNKLDLNPKSLGERWFQNAVNQTYGKMFPFIGLCAGIVFVAMHYLVSDKQNYLSIGLVSMFVFGNLLQMHFANRILRRQQEEIEGLRKVLL